MHITLETYFDDNDAEHFFVFSVSGAAIAQSVVDAGCTADYLVVSSDSIFSYLKCLQ